MDEYEGSRAEFMKMLAEHDGPPAYILRAQRVEQAWESLIRKCQNDQRELLEMPRTRLAQVAALIDHDWTKVDAFVEENEFGPYLRGLHADWHPELRIQIDATTSLRKIRASLRDLANSFSRFNRRWDKRLSEINLEHVNYERREYNNYYLVEKAAALGSDKLAEMGFEPLVECTLDDVRNSVPLLRIPNVL